MLNHLPHAINHIIGTRLLPLLAIHRRPVPNLLRVRNNAGARDAGPNRRKLVKGLGVAELAAGDGGGELVVAGGHVVGDCVAEDVVLEVCSRHVFAVFADDDGEFAFVVELRLAGGVDGDAV